MRIVRRTLVYLRNHDWAAVLIEVVVVVLGVFIGIQAANWNEAREEDRRAAVFSERLREDLRGEDWAYQMQISYYTDVLANAQRAADALSGRAALPDEALLVAAYRATQYNTNIRQRATYDELVSTGEIGLIRDRELRNLAQRVFTSPIFDEIDNQARGSEYRHWFRLNIDHQVQDRLLRRCGDRVTRPGVYADIPHALDYPCETGLGPEDLQPAVERLRQDAAALPMLRLRLADTQTALFNLTVYNRDLHDGLAALRQP